MENAKKQVKDQLEQTKGGGETEGTKGGRSSRRNGAGLFLNSLGRVEEPGRGNAKKGKFKK